MVRASALDCHAAVQCFFVEKGKVPIARFTLILNRLADCHLNEHEIRTLVHNLNGEEKHHVCFLPLCFSTCIVMFWLDSWIKSQSNHCSPATKKQYKVWQAAERLPLPWQRPQRLSWQGRASRCVLRVQCACIGWDARRVIPNCRYQREGRGGFRHFFQILRLASSKSWEYVASLHVRFGLSFLIFIDMSSYQSSKSDTLSKVYRFPRTYFLMAIMRLFTEFTIDIYWLACASPGAGHLHWGLPDRALLVIVLILHFVCCYSN